MSAPGPVRVNTPCPTCGEFFFTEVDEDFPRDAQVIRMRHRGYGAERFVSNDMLRLAAVRGDVFQLTVASVTEAVARATKCLEFAPPPPEPWWKTVNAMGYGPVFADPAALANPA